jgi:hypothetical protein
MIVQTRFGSISMVGGYCWTHSVPARGTSFPSRGGVSWAGWIWDVVSFRQARQP